MKKKMALAKCKAFADDKVNVDKMISVFIRVDNIFVKGENAGYQHFLLFHSVFQSLLPQGQYKFGLCGRIREQDVT